MKDQPGPRDFVLRPRQEINAMPTPALLTFIAARMNGSSIKYSGCVHRSNGSISAPSISYQIVSDPARRLLTEF